MPEILSKQEIDSLLGTIASSGQNVSESGKPSSPSFEKIKTSFDEEDKSIESFDFRLPQKLSDDHLRVLRAVHENFADAYKTYLVSSLQMMVSINLQNIEQVRYNEYVCGNTFSRCLYIFRIEESSSYAVLEFSNGLMSALVDRLLGGGTLSESFLDASHFDRSLTKVEQSIVKKFSQKALSDLQNSWRRLSPLTFRLERFESKSDFAQVTSSNEIVSVFTFDVAIGDKHYMMSVCFPAPSIKSVLEKLEGESKFQFKSHERDSWKPTISKNLLPTDVNISVRLGQALLSIQELLNVEVGDVLKLNSKITDEVKILVNGKEKFLGKAGVNNDTVAVKVTQKNFNEQNK